ncbi:hypothetical protein PC123_g9320 [Phytophthora cactorum]|nr:hypothetical protein PC120_g9246 [Phytophthora cactorum]KAG4055577.1 hypothetical protein PC123_g9320 [Phytophthora cactorum]
MLSYTVLPKYAQITSELHANSNSDVRCKGNLGENISYASPDIEEAVHFTERPASFKYL